MKFGGRPFVGGRPGVRVPCTPCAIDDHLIQHMYFSYNNTIQYWFNDRKHTID